MLRKTKEKKAKVEEMDSKGNSRSNEGETLHNGKKGHKLY